MIKIIILLFPLFFPPFLFATGTAYMGLLLPTPGSTIGPTWATMLNAALTTIDSHNHAYGKGVQIPSVGIGINADLTFAGYNAIVLRSTRYQDQATPITGTSDHSAIYSSGGDLWWNNGSGSPVQITSGTGINVSSLGTIGGDYGLGAESVTYSNSNKTYSFLQAPSTAGAINGGNLSIYEQTSGGKYVQLKTPTALAANYTVTLPPAQGAANTILNNDGTGVTTWGKISDSNITAQSISRASLAAVGMITSAPSVGDSMTSGVATDVINLSLSITTTGRPVVVALVSGGGIAIPSAIGISSNSLAHDYSMYVDILRGASVISRNQITGIISSANVTTALFAPYNILQIDTPTSGTYTYKVQATLVTGAIIRFYNLKLIAYEL